MTFVGKVLIVMQVVFSIFFMAFAAAVYATHTNWKARHDKLTTDSATQVSKLETDKQELAAANDLLVKSEAAAKDQVGVLQAQVDGLTRQAEALKGELKEEKDANIKGQAVAARYEIEADFRKDEAGSQRTRNDALLDSREELVTRVQQLLDEKFNREAELEKIVERYETLLLQNTELTRIIAANGLSTDPQDYVGKQTPPPAVEGMVWSTRRGKRSGTEFIEITLGSDDGLLVGHDLDVYRSGEGSKYLGKIRIVYVEPDKAVGTVVKRARNGSIQRGDNVTTDL